MHDGTTKGLKGVAGREGRVRRDERGMETDEKPKKINKAHFITSGGPDYFGMERCQVSRGHLSALQLSSRLPIVISMHQAFIQVVVTEQREIDCPLAFPTNTQRQSELPGTRQTVRQRRRGIARDIDVLYISGASFPKSGVIGVICLILFLKTVSGHYFGGECSSKKDVQQGRPRAD